MTQFYTPSMVNEERLDTLLKLVVRSISKEVDARLAGCSSPKCAKRLPIRWHVIGSLCLGMAAMPALAHSLPEATLFERRDGLCPSCEVVEPLAMTRGVLQIPYGPIPVNAAAVISTLDFTNTHASMTAVVQSESKQSSSMVVMLTAYSDEELLFHTYKSFVVEAGVSQAVHLNALVPKGTVRLVLNFQVHGLGGLIKISEIAVDEHEEKNAKSSPEAVAYLSNAMDIIGKKSVVKNKLAWPLLRANAEFLADGASSVGDVHPAIRYLTNALDDRHSAFKSEDEANALVESLRVSGTARDALKGFMTRDGFAYVAIPGYTSESERERHDFAVSIAMRVRDLAASHPHGWIIDLRNDVGGALYVQLAGLSAILGNGLIGAMAQPDGDSTPCFNRRGAILVQRQGRLGVEEEVPSDLVPDIPTTTPVALLIGKKTVSAGEGLGISLLGRPTLRSFGSATAGSTSGVTVYKFSDGARLFLAESIFENRNGRKFDGPIIPDVIVNSDSADATGDDLALAAAKAWLNSLSVSR